jgi:hypothetical protein
MQFALPHSNKPVRRAVLHLHGRLLPFVSSRQVTFNRVFVAFALAILCVLTSQTAFSQDAEDRLPEGVVPPPLNLISKEEHTALEAEEKLKNRTKLALGLIESRLSKSETSADKEEFQESLDQLGRFQALIRHTFVFLKNNEGRKDSFKNFKRFEMTLRDFLPRLELLRRELPYKYSYHVEKMILFVRDARSNALEPLFEDTVIPEGGSR